MSAGVLSGLLLLATNAKTVAQQARLTGVDHIGINVPDLGQAQQFFKDVLGFQTVTHIGPITLDNAWKETNRLNLATGALLPNRYPEDYEFETKNGCAQEVAAVKY